LDCSFGFRPNRSAHQALDELEKNLKAGRTAVYDADLKGYFDSIPHDKLMKAVEFRIADRSVLRLIRMWLTTPVIERDERGQTTKTHPKRGTPQGGVISPLLANLYLHWFDKVFHGKDAPKEFANARMVRYADDFVIMARYMGKRITDWIEGKIEGWMGLTINRDKTKVINAKESSDGITFLGYTIRCAKSRFGQGATYWRREPSKKSLKKAFAKIHELTEGRLCCVPFEVVLSRLKNYLRGWKNYFGRGHPRKSFRKVEYHVRNRLYQFLKRRSQRPFKLPEGMSWYEFLQMLLADKRVVKSSSKSNSHKLKLTK
jgi:RNA-directed DNA polymerase